MGIGVVAAVSDAQADGIRNGGACVEYRDVGLQALNGFFKAGAVLHVAQHYELVTAVARDEIVLAEGFLEQIRRVLQGLVSRIVPVEVVDHFKGINIDHDAAEGIVAADLRGGLQVPVQLAAVENASEVVAVQLVVLDIDEYDKDGKRDAGPYKRIPVKCGLQQATDDGRERKKHEWFEFVCGDPFFVAENEKLRIGKIEECKSRHDEKTAAAVVYVCAVYIEIKAGKDTAEADGRVGKDGGQHGQEDPFDALCILVYVMMRVQNPKGAYKGIEHKINSRNNPVGCIGLYAGFCFKQIHADIQYYDERVRNDERPEQPLARCSVIEVGAHGEGNDKQYSQRERIDGYIQQCVDVRTPSFLCCGANIPKKGHS